MSQPSAEAARVSRLGGVVSAARFVATDRLGLLILMWALVAFVARPVLLGAIGGAEGWPFEGLRAAMKPVALAHTVSVIQWVSFAGLMALAAIGHLRYAAAKPDAFADAKSRFRIAAGYVALMCLAYVVFLWAPVSVFTLITHDSFIFFDSTYRIANGLTPSTDFPTALGSASLYLPAWAAWVGGGYGGSVELASVWVAAGLGLACAVVGASRMPAAMTATLAASVFLVTVPGALLEQWGGEAQTLVDGETEVLGDNLSWAMFYNRWGWAALIPLLMVLAPRKDKANKTGESAPPLAEIGVMAAVLVFLFWLKLTYFAAGVGAAAIYAFYNPKPVRTLAWGAGMTAAGVLAIGLITGNLIAYIGDILLAGKVSGARTESILGLIRQNVQDILFATAPLAVLAAMGRFTWRDALAGGFMLAMCLFVINQNGQLKNMSALIAIAAYGAVRVMGEADAGRMARIAAVGGFAMLALASMVDRGMVLIDQAYAIQREQVRPPAPWAREQALRNVYIPERESMFNRTINRSETAEDRLHNLWLSGQLGRRQELRQGEYMETLMAGVDDLRTAIKPGDSVATLDMTNPFPFLMGVRAPKGMWLTFHKNRTISEATRPAPETLFADTDHVMVARMSMVQSTADLMMEMYGPWLDRNYEVRVETPYWTRWSHRKKAQVAEAAIPAIPSPTQSP